MSAAGTYSARNRQPQSHVLAPTDFTNRVVVTIYDTKRRRGVASPVFDLVFFGIPLDDFYIVPGGADPILTALKKRGLDPKRYRPLGMFDCRKGDPIPTFVPRRTSHVHTT